MEIRYGNPHYGPKLGSITDAELQEYTEKFSNNYWGLISEEQYSINKKAILFGKGEVRGTYLSANKILVHVISLEDRSNSIFCTQEDLDDGFYELVVTKAQAKSSRGNGYNNFFANYKQRMVASAVAPAIIFSDEGF